MPNLIQVIHSSSRRSISRSRSDNGRGDGGGGGDDSSGSEGKGTSMPNSAHEMSSVSSRRGTRSCRRNSIIMFRVVSRSELSACALVYMSCARMDPTCVSPQGSGAESSIQHMPSRPAHLPLPSAIGQHLVGLLVAAGLDP